MNLIIPACFDERANICRPLCHIMGNALWQIDHHTGFIIEILMLAEAFTGSGSPRLSRSCAFQTSHVTRSKTVTHEPAAHTVFELLQSTSRGTTILAITNTTNTVIIRITFISIINIIRIEVITVIVLNIIRTIIILHYSTDECNPLTTAFLIMCHVAIANVIKNVNRKKENVVSTQYAGSACAGHLLRKSILCLFHVKHYYHNLVIKTTNVSCNTRF